MLNMTIDFEKSPSIINRILKAVFSKKISHGSNFTGHNITRHLNSASAAYIVRKIDRVSGYLNKLLWWLLEPDCHLLWGLREKIGSTQQQLLSKCYRAIFHEFLYF